EPGSAVPEADAASPVAVAVPELPVRFRRLRRFGGRLRPRGRRGQLILLTLVAGFAVAMTAGGVVALQWTETADFCGRCHTMAPELKGHEISAHRELACADCHVEPGVQGWIKAKINGTKQLVEILLGTFPTPIPPPGHDDLPPSTATCRRCHDVAQLLENGGPIKFVLKSRFDTNATNTRSSVALVIRPMGLGEGIETKGIHWHVVSDVELSASDPRSQKIDLVRVTNPDGSQSTFIAMSQVQDPANVQPDISRLVSADHTSRMDCIDCHNRAGHNVPTLSDAIDQAMSQGQIDASLPYVKLQALDLLSATYASEADAFAALNGLMDYYLKNDPTLVETKTDSIRASIAELKTIYQLVATPDMKVSAQTYPDNLGHTQYPGCFRCHDGGHYEVVDGKLTGNAIPSGCATCHTFPQIGANTSAILIGERPQSHLDKLWVFNHKSVVTTVDPSNSSCGACHTRTYCENCHDTPAVQVPHDEMVFNHAAVVRQVGAAACTLCHQQSYCSQCHADQVLPTDGSVPGILPSGSPGAPVGSGWLQASPSLPAPGWSVFPSASSSGSASPGP
ncbi:MAG TPA: NapC/NirT family cytochrome c, partial [Candidatus Binatus sp.]|nr:NapC/NirT family cytochrome c [Candidatus Binatus sp.]